MGKTEAPAAQRPIDWRALERELAAHAHTEVRIVSHERLSGGAIQQNWKVELVLGTEELDWHSGLYVLRLDSAATVEASSSRATEFEVLRAAYRASVPCPRPAALSTAGEGATGRPYVLMQWLPGVAAGHRLARDDGLVPDRDALVIDLARALARIHSIDPSSVQIPGLPPASLEPTAQRIEEMQHYLQQLPGGYPALEWTLRECLRMQPPPQPPVLIHRDFRTGNYLVDHGRLSAVLDWEFAGWGDPREDVGWFSARCWRFGAIEREAGGIGDLDLFLATYNDASGAALTSTDLPYWQLLAHVRWAVIALQQVGRHLSGRERSLELALTGRLLPELEQEALDLAEAL